jgi:hypothetical protein
MAVDRDAGRLIESVLADAAVVRGLAGKAAKLPEDKVRVKGVGADRSAVFDHAIVAGVCHPNVVVAVDGDALRIA